MRKVLLGSLLPMVVAFVAFSCGSRSAEGPGPIAPVGSQAVPPPQSIVQKTLADVGIEASAMDRTVNPCDDFYAYSCGNWLKTTKIPEDESRWARSFNEIHKRNELELRAILEDAAQGKLTHPVASKIGAYYAACMDEASVEKNGVKAIEPLRAKVKNLKSAKELPLILGELHKYQTRAIFEITRDQDAQDATKVIAVLDQSGLGLPDRDYYLKDDDISKKHRRYYEEHTARLLKLGGLPAPLAVTAAREILQLETELAKVSKSRVERRDPVTMYNKVDRVGLAQLAPDFDWNAYFTALGFPGIQEISVTSKPFFEGMNKLVKSVKPAQWQRYLDLVILRSFANTLPKAFVDEAFALKKALTDQPALEERWRRCVAATDQGVGELVAQPFIDRKFGGGSKQTVETMVYAIRDAFGKSLDSIEWMDASTKLKAQEKLKMMAYLVGYPAAWRAYNFELNRADFAGNVLKALDAEQKYQLEKVGKPTDRAEWYMTPQTVNAYYDPTKNQMVFPAGILQPPFFSANFGVAVNMGAMGMVVGHELTHGFDDQGAQFAGNGNLSNWWAKETGERFKQKGTCVADQYSKYEVLPSVKLDGRLTLGENIADIGGAKLAFYAYRALRQSAPEKIYADGLTEDQQFFVSFGQAWCALSRDEMSRLLAKVDPHSQPRYRVNGTVSDLSEFSQAFSCPKGAAMSPAAACSVW